MHAQRNFPYLQFPLLLIIVLSILLSACQSGATSDAHEVVYWTSDNAPIHLQAQRDMVAAFTRANPDVHVKMVVLPGTVTDITSLLTAVRGGTGPDVYWLDRFTVSQYASIGLLQDLQPRIAKENSDRAQNYLPFAWKETLYRRHPYALPMETDARALYYNKDMLRDAGINPDTLDPSHGPITLAQLAQIEAKVDHLDSRGAYDRLGFIPFHDQAFHVTWAMDYGARFFDAAKCQVTPTESAMLKAYQLEYDWTSKISVFQAGAFLATYQPANAPPAQDPFFTGHLAMTINGNGYIQNIQKYAPNLHYGVTYIPVPQAGQAPSTWSGGFSVVMPHGAHNPDGAWRFMRFMSGAEGQRIFVKEAGVLPTWSALLKEPGLINGNTRFFAQALSYSRSRVPLPVGALYFDEMSTALQAVLFHTARPQQALQTVYDHVQPQMDQYCPLP